MGRIMQPARTPRGVEAIRGLAYTGTVYRGSVLIYNAGNVQVGGVDPTNIMGVALQASDTNPGYAAANNPTTITGRSAVISVATADRVTVFSAAMTNGSSTRVAPVAADVGVSYGLTAYTNIWTVDRAKVGVLARVQVIGYDTGGLTNMVFFKFLESAISPNA